MYSNCTLNQCTLNNKTRQHNPTTKPQVATGRSAEGLLLLLLMAVAFWAADMSADSRLQQQARAACAARPTPPPTPDCAAHAARATRPRRHHQPKPQLNSTELRRALPHI